MVAPAIEGIDLFNMDKPLFQADADKTLFVTNEEQQAESGWQWLFDLRALPREESYMT